MELLMTEEQQHDQLLSNQVLMMKALKLLVRDRMEGGAYMANELQRRIGDVEALLERK
jgi:hypothetical protein